MCIILNKQGCFLFLLAGFGTVFAAPGNGIYQIDYWRHNEDKELIPVDPDDIRPPFRSCYLIIQREKGANPEDWNVFYYVPRVYLKEDVLLMASVAAATDHRLHSKNRFRRELEGYESTAFRDLVPDFKRFSNDRDVVDETIDWHADKLFIFTENRDKRLLMTEVSIELKYIIGKGDAEHCLVCALDDVYVYCDKSANKEKKRGAGELAKILSERREKTSSNVITVAAPRQHAFRKEIPYSQFLEKFNRAIEARMNSDTFRSSSPSTQSGFTDETRHRGFTMREMRQILNQSTLKTDKNETKEYFEPTIHNIGREGRSLLYIEHYNEPCEDCKYIYNMEHTQCYVIDSKSNLGILVWMGANARVEAREAAVMKAEHCSLFSREYGRPIIFMDQNDVISKRLNESRHVLQTSIEHFMVEILDTE